jgi:hypothetical protein
MRLSFVWCNRPQATLSEQRNNHIMSLKCYKARRFANMTSQVHEFLKKFHRMLVIYLKIYLSYIVIVSSLLLLVLIIIDR